MPPKKKKAQGETVDEVNAHAQDMMMTPEMMMAMMQQGMFMGQGGMPPLGMQGMPPQGMSQGMPPGMMQPGMMQGMQPGMMQPGMQGMQPNRPPLGMPPGMMQGMMQQGMQPGMMPQGMSQGMPPGMMGNQMDMYGGYGGYGGMEQQPPEDTGTAGDDEAAAKEKADRDAGLHITIDSLTIKFDAPNGNVQSRRITIKNLSDTKRIAFKVQTNKPDMYLVTPAKGVLISGKKEVIEVELKGTVSIADINKDKNNHKFNIQTMPWPDSKKQFDVALWDKDKKSDALKTATVKVDPCV